ncbi:MAG: hypothetical protein AABX14_05560 [Candidatus Aenigmatarchaeota archaeon]
MVIFIRKLKRKCLVCGKSINIVVKNREYSGGNYFGEIKLPVKPGEYKKVGTTKIGRTKADVVKWTGKEKKIEYWECNKCFEDASHECWLEEKIEKLFGKRCKKYEPACPACQAWFICETIIKDNKGKL